MVIKRKGKIEDESLLIKTDIIGAIKTERKRRGWSQKELAKKAGLAQVDVSRIELGKAKKSRLVRICEALDMPYYFARDNLDAKLINEFRGLSKEDKYSVLRMIIRMKNTPEKTSEILHDIVSEDL